MYSSYGPNLKKKIIAFNLFIMLAFQMCFYFYMIFFGCPLNTRILPLGFVAQLQEHLCNSPGNQYLKYVLIIIIFLVISLASFPSLLISKKNIEARGKINRVLYVTGIDVTVFFFPVLLRY